MRTKILIIFLVFNVSLFAQNNPEPFTPWQNVGNPNTNWANPSIAVNGRTPYVAYNVAGNIEVDYYNGTSWVKSVTVGDGTIDIPPFLAMGANNTMYLGYGVTYNPNGSVPAYVTNLPVIWEYNGTSWSPLPPIQMPSGFNYNLDNDNCGRNCLFDNINISTATSINYPYVQPYLSTAQQIEGGGDQVINISYAVSPNGVLYVAYEWFSSSSAQITNIEVLRYKNGSWQYVQGNENGIPYVSSGIYGTKLYVDANETPYVMFHDPFNSNYALVMKYGSSGWAYWDEIPTTSLVHTLAFQPGTNYPYIAYTDQTNGNKVTVEGYNGSTFKTIGNAGFSPSSFDWISMIYTSNGPMVAYSHISTGSPYATVMQLNSSGSSWTNIGNVNVSNNLGEAQILSLTEGSGVPYLALGGSIVPYLGSVFQYCNNEITSAISASSNTVCSNASVVLTANPTTTGYKYQWSNSTGVISGATNSTYTASSQNIYGLTITDQYGCSTSSAAFPVNNATATISSATGYTTLCPGGSVVLNANPGVGLKYQWSNSGSPISGATNQSYTAVAVGTYAVTITNSQNNCSSVSAGLAITAGSGAIPSATISSPTNPAYFCPGSSVTLNATTNSGLSYEWSANTGLTPNWTPVGNPDYITSNNTIANALVLDANGNPYIAYSSYPFGLVAKYNGATSSTSSDWQFIGSPQGAVFNPGVQLNIDPFGNLFAAYRYNQAGIAVSKLVGTSWQIVSTGNPILSVGSIAYPSITTNSQGTPYIAYSDGANGGKIAVMDYTGATGTGITGWFPTGNSILSGSASYISIKIDPLGNPYVAYLDGSYSNNVTVQKFYGGLWSPVGGQPGFTTNASGQDLSFALDNQGNPYIAYSSVSGGVYSINVLKNINNTGWTTVGTSVISNGRNPSLKLDPNNIPYIAYQDLSQTSKGVVVKYNGTNWVNVGNPGGLPSASAPLLAIDANGVPLIAYSDVISSDVAVMKFNGESSYTTSTSGNYTLTVTNISTGCSASSSPVFVNDGAPVVITNTLPQECEPGSAFSISFNQVSSSCGGFNNNLFTAQLSDASGSFANPVFLGNSVRGNATSGTIIAVIPQNTPVGTNYRIRIVSSSPATIGPDNGVNIAMTNSANTLLFDNGGNPSTRVTINNNSVYNLSGNFTIEAWTQLFEYDYNPTAPIVSSRSSNGTDGFLFSMLDDQLFLQIGSASYASSSTYPNSSENYNLTNGCHHVAVTRSNGVLTFYIDGQAAGTVSNVTTAINSASPYVYIGYDANYNGTYNSFYNSYDDGSFNGYLNDIRIWNIAQPATTIASNMGIEVPPTSPGLIANWNCDMIIGNDPYALAAQTVYDLSPTANDGYLGTTKSTDSQDPIWSYGVKCIKAGLETGLTFNGQYGGSRATLPNNAAYNFGNGPFTLEAWVNIGSQSGTAPGIIANRQGSGYPGSTNGLLFSTLSGNDLLLEMGGVNYYSHGFGNIENAGCNHIAVVNNGAGALQFYLNGSPLGGTISCSTSVASSTGNLYIGYDPVNATTLNGSINEIRIWNAALAPYQISGNLNTVFPANTPNLVGYWKLDESDDEVIFDASSTANNGYLGTVLDYDPQDPIRENIVCNLGGERLAYVQPIIIDSSGFTNNLTTVNVKIYPNPFNTTTNIIVSGTSTEHTAIRILDVQGVTLYTGQISFNTEYSIGQQLSGGMYFVEVTGEDKQPHVYKIIKAE